MRVDPLARSRLSLTISAFTSALVLTVFAGWQVAIYLHPAAWRMALWLPVAGLIHAREIGFILVWLLQFPVLAAAFVVACRRWASGKVLACLLVLYALCSVGAYFMVKAHPYGSENTLR